MRSFKTLLELVRLHLSKSHSIIICLQCSTRTLLTCISTLMHLSIVCPTSPCSGIGGAKGGFDCEVYFNPAPLGLTEGSIPHFKGGS